MANEQLEYIDHMKTVADRNRDKQKQFFEDRGWNKEEITWIFRRIDMHGKRTELAKG